MKDVESESHSDGTIGLACKRSNLKLDKLTIYVCEWRFGYGQIISAGATWSLLM